MWNYRIAGLGVSSELSLPGMVSASPPAGAPDVTIRRAAVPPHLASATAAGPDWAVEGDRFLFSVAGVARFLITAGREITYDVDASTEEADVALFLLGTAFGILLQQRGHLVLHASAVAVNGCAVLFCGASGAGKSTLAAALLRNGRSLVTDDVCHVSFDDEGRPTVAPDGRMLKLWADALDFLALGHEKSQPVGRRADKYYVAPAQTTDSPRLPLAAIYFLRETHPPEAIGITALNVAEAGSLVASNAYRPQLTAAMGLVRTQFMDAARLWQHARLFSLARPLDFSVMDTVIEHLEAHWSDLGLRPASGSRKAS